MKTNMGSMDRLIRLAGAVVFFILYFTGTVSGIPGILLLVAGLVFTLTSLLRFCPLYTLLGINTCRTEK